MTISKGSTMTIRDILFRIVLVITVILIAMLIYTSISTARRMGLSHAR